MDIPDDGRTGNIPCLRNLGPHRSFPFHCNFVSVASSSLTGTGEAW